MQRQLQDIIAITLFACGLVFAPLGAAQPGELSEYGLATGASHRVVVVIDGDTVRLADGNEVRLVGIQAPKLPLGRPGFAAWPLADEAKAALEEMVLDRQVTLHYGGRRTDRYGRALAHMVRDDGLWVQSRLLEEGLARVYTFADNRGAVAGLLAAEKTGRSAARGLWSDPFYRILDHAHAAEGIGGYGLVEGVVTQAAVVKGRGFLNFGPDYRTDFTISIAPEDMGDAFDGIDLDDYVGVPVRVRGWLREINGVSIDVTHPEQIESLTEN
ncbi:MAG: thermonuclease family protein [Alphaproteobacteria bacterium]|nr:thermonuclease family protein [Alphaproteobacteria bacterium]MCZ6764952.1 thermonuclease family protein [Alphaproteobacteria bacterium]